MVQSNGGKNQASTFYKKIFLHKLLLTNKKHAEPKGEKTIHAPENCTTQNIMVRLLVS